jgi:drug/metabolite transporter (DMT)-like permease
MNRHHYTLGLALVAASALLWSLGGTISRFIHVDVAWTSVFWRSYFATVFLLCFMIWQEGLDGMLRDFRQMGWPGLIVSVCFAGASTCFIIALTYTTVANILLIQAAVPLIAALLAFLLFREKASTATWIAIAAVFTGVAIMVSDSPGNAGSAIGNGLSLLIAVLFSVATVTTRRFSNTRMTPAVTLGTFIACVFAAIMGGADVVSLPNLAWLLAFGAINLGLGLACFALGARYVPAAMAALIGTIETVLGPIWVWLVHAEVPSERTLIGGTVVFAALIAHILVDMWRNNAAKNTADA